MFVDIARVVIKAGNGGDGLISFRHEKFIDKGGPDGGDGGNGGDVLFVASRNQNTLANFRYQKTLTAPSGQPGKKAKQHGKSGDNLIVEVPVGTVVNSEDNTVLADLAADAQEVVIAKGGKGGFGNAHFVSSTRQAPRIHEKGEAGEELTVILELKMIADVGLVGLPNAGKSTLLSVLSNARPEIANYPFTTLTPNLGVVDINKSRSLLFADIPGLIAGAAKGKGLGDEFLRHVERTAILVHLIDAYQPDVAVAYKTIQKELKAYKYDLTKRPQIVALTKVEGVDDQLLKRLTTQLQKVVVPKKTAIVAISAKSQQGIPELLKLIDSTIRQERTKRQKTAKPDIPVIRLTDSDQTWRINQMNKRVDIVGVKIERFARRTDFTSEAGVQRLKDIMKRMGIYKELERLGVQPADDITIGGSYRLKL